jgi:hypothetical protein
MPAALPAKQQCFGDPASSAQRVKLGNPRNMSQAAEKGREGTACRRRSVRRERAAGDRKREGGWRNKLCRNRLGRSMLAAFGPRAAGRWHSTTVRNLITRGRA